MPRACFKLNERSCDAAEIQLTNRRAWEERQLEEKVFVALKSEEKDSRVREAIWYSSSKDDLIAQLERREDGAEPHLEDRQEPKETKTYYAKIGNEFKQALDGMRTTIPVLMTMLPVFKDFSFRIDLEKYVIEHGIAGGELKDWKIFELDAHHAANLRATGRKLEAITGFQATLPKMFIMGLVAIYDGFLGNLLKEAIRLKPGALSSDKTLTLAELRSLKSVESATEYFIEREVDGVLRGSHRQQLEWIKKRFNIDVEDTFEKLPEFLEICERRNLFTHNNGIINQSSCRF